MTKENKRELMLDLICKEQQRMLIRESDSYKSEKYIKLEELKTEVKKMTE